ncbi:hypothetical protein TNCV_2325991 [Trichonephila clavipes]|nr:hypothetical protein TNCV_2325991 [Trichonephila clavipes]
MLFDTVCEELSSFDKDADCLYGAPGRITEITPPIFLKIDGFRRSALSDSPSLKLLRRKRLISLSQKMDTDGRRVEGDHPFLPDHDSEIGVIVVKKQQQRNVGVDVPPQGW